MNAPQQALQHSWKSRQCKQPPLWMFYCVAPHMVTLAGWLSSKAGADQVSGGYVYQCLAQGSKAMLGFERVLQGRLQAFRRERFAVRLVRKRAAVEAEDYDAAKALKVDIARLRTSADPLPAVHGHSLAQPQQQHLYQHPPHQQQLQAPTQLLQPQAGNGGSAGAGGHVRWQGTEGEENLALPNQGWGAPVGSPAASAKRASPRSHSLDTDSLASPLGAHRDSPLRCAVCVALSVLEAGAMSCGV